MKDKVDKNTTHEQKHRKSADQAPLDASEQTERKKIREAKRWWFGWYMALLNPVIAARMGPPVASSW